MGWFERNFGKVWAGVFALFLLIDLAIVGLAVWGVITLINWVVAQ